MKFLVLSCVVIGALAELPRFRPARFRFQRQELAPTTTDSPTESTTEPSGPYPASGWKPAGEPFTLPNEQPEKPADQYGAPDAGYPASGWKPAGEPFTLPNEQPEKPADQYGAPDAGYPASGWKPAGEPFTLPNEQPEKPADQYGAPDAGYPASGWKPQGQAFELPKQTPPATSYGVPDNTYGVPDSTEVPTTDNPLAERLEGPVEVQKSVGTYFVLLPNGQLQKVEFVTENDVQNMKYTARLQLRKPAPLLVFRP